MSHNVDPNLLGRHVGREDIVAALQHNLSAHLAAAAPIPMYLFGPRGVGKSHVVALARMHAEEEGLRTALISEDIPILRTAEAIIGRIRGAFVEDVPAWQRWAGSALPPAPSQRSVLFFEGWDRQLLAMTERERQRLRRWLTERAHIYIIATGISLCEPMVGKETAFYQGFDPWPLRPLEVAQATQLIEQVVDDEVRSASTWSARRGALVRLAGGSPRTLIALGRSCCHAPDDWATAHLCRVLYGFTAHYQLLFRDLPGQGQQLVELMALAPRALSPTEMSARLGMSPAQVSTIARRLLDNGVLRSRQEGRRSWYSLSEPLFRYWLEYRSAPWSQTRVGLIARLLEALGTSTAFVGSGHGLPLVRFCSQPVRAFPGESSALAALLLRALRRDEDHPYAVLSWAASFSRFGDDDWERLLEALRSASLPDRPLHDPDVLSWRLYGRLALTALGQRSPERLHALLGLSGVREDVQVALALTRQMSEEDGALHPELAHLRRELWRAGEEAGRPGSR